MSDNKITDFNLIYSKFAKLIIIRGTAKVLLAKFKSFKASGIVFNFYETICIVILLLYIRWLNNYALLFCNLLFKRNNVRPREVSINWLILLYRHNFFKKSNAMSYYSIMI